MAAEPDVQDLEALLEESDVLHDMLPATRRQLLLACHKVSVAKGDLLIRTGDAADALYFVLSGRFVVMAKGRPIAFVSDGEPLGELGFFSEGARTTDVVATRDSSVLKLSRTAYDIIARDNPDLPASILKIMAMRLSKATVSSRVLTPQPGRITCIAPVTGQTLPEGFARQFAQALNAHPGWAMIDHTDAMASGVAPDALSRWILARQATEGHVVLIAPTLDPGDAWSEAALKLADTTFLVASPAGAPPEPGLPERKILQDALASNRHLVICRNQGAEAISGARHWLAQRPVGLHHHLALDTEADFQRLARFVTGTATGLVLAGGGAFGAAHLGAIKAMQERGIVFDMVGGTSIGSAMAAVLGMGMDPLEAIDICQDMFLRKNAMRRFTAPVYSVVDHLRLDELLQTHYGQRRIEDMPINFFAAATSMTHNDLKILRQGPLWQAVRASTSLPGLFPPMVLEDGEILVDGGLLDNVPLTEMRELKAGRNLVFNFDFGNEWRSKAAYGDLPGRLKSLGILIGLRRPLKPRFPSIFSVLVRSMVVGARRLMSNLDLKDDILVTLKPVPGMGFLEWKKARRQYDASHREMSDLLDALGVHAGQDDMTDKLSRIASGFLAIQAENADLSAEQPLRA